MPASISSSARNARDFAASGSAVWMVRRSVLVHTVRASSCAHALADEARQVLRVLLAAGGEVGVAADDPEHVERALAVSREPDGPRRDVQVDEQRHEPAGQVRRDPVEDDLLPDVDDLDVAAVRVVERLVDALVVADARAEVAHGLLGIHARIVGHAQLRLAHVGVDDGRVVADRLDEDERDAALLAARLDDAAAVLRAVRGVVDADLAAVVEPVEEIVERHHGDVVEGACARPRCRGRRTRWAGGCRPGRGGSCRR